MDTPKEPQSGLTIRLHSDLRDDIEQAAELYGITPSAWCRERLRQMAMLDLVKAGKKPRSQAIQHLPFKAIALRAKLW